MNKYKIMVTTHPFCSVSDLPIKMLHGHEVYLNDVGRKYSPEELLERLVKFNPDIIIAGTEKYTSDTLDLLPDLKMISRVGIGLDSVPLEECKKRGIVVSYTPDGPSNAVAELAVGQMINMLRRIQLCDATIRNGGWNRHIGREIRSCDVGVIGCGRIGKLIVEKMQGLKPRRVFVNDIIHERAEDLPRSEQATKAQILSDCDIITIHIPYNDQNHDYITKKDFDIMKKDVSIINMSRGGIVNEKDLYDFLSENPSASAAIDTFEVEPYKDCLVDLPNAYLTPHLGSCSKMSRNMMEVGAAEEVINFISGEQISNRVV